MSHLLFSLINFLVFNWSFIKCIEFDVGFVLISLNLFVGKSLMDELNIFMI